MDEDLNLFNEYLIKYEGAIYDNYEAWASYLKNEVGMHFKYSPMDLCINASFSSGGVEFVWVEHTGQHVISVMEWEEFKRYLKYLEKKNG